MQKKKKRKEISVKYKTRKWGIIAKQNKQNAILRLEPLLSHTIVTFYLLLKSWNARDINNVKWILLFHTGIA